MSRVLAGNTSIQPEGAYFVFIERVTRNTDDREIRTQGCYRTNQPPSEEGPLSEALRHERSETLASWEVRYCHRTELGRALRDYNERRGPRFERRVSGDYDNGQVGRGEDDNDNDNEVGWGSGWEEE